MPVRRFKLPARFMIAMVALCIAAFGTSAPSRAGDYAERRVIGFSPDGGTFAFEQFGVQDGSGFPYADIFVIDTGTDRWVPGSPFRALIRDERAPLKSARENVQTGAGDLLRQRNVSEPGRLLAANPPGEVSADPYNVTVNTSPSPIMTPVLWTFSLEEMPVTSTDCAAFTDAPIKGFRLTARRDGQPPRTLHTDTALPKSRGCALRYAISDIVIHERNGGPNVFAVLVSIFSHGFEGPDRRFLAITARLP